MSIYRDISQETMRSFNDEYPVFWNDVNDQIHRMNEKGEVPLIKMRINRKYSNLVNNPLFIEKMNAFIEEKIGNYEFATARLVPNKYENDRDILIFQFTVIAKNTYMKDSDKYISSKEVGVQLKKLCRSAGVPNKSVGVSVQACQSVIDDGKTEKPTLADAILNRGKSEQTWVVRVEEGGKSALPSVPKPKWIDRDKSKNELAHEFILRVWGKWYESGELTKNVIRNNDRALLTALERQYHHKDITKRPPEDFSLPTKEELNDRLLDDIRQSKEMPADSKEQNRIRSLAHRRGISVIQKI